MSIININGTFNNEENGTFTAKVGLGISSEAPLDFHDFVDAVQLDNENPEERTFDGMVFDNIADVVLEFPEFFEIDWVESDKVDTVDLKDLTGIHSIV